VDGAIEALSGERLLEDAALGVPVEETAQEFQFGDDLGGVFHQHPGQFLVVDEGAASDGVFEVQVEGIFGVEDGVIASLYHSGAPALPDQPFCGHDDAQVLIGSPGVEGCQQSRATAADNQDVCFQSLIHRTNILWNN